MKNSVSVALNCWNSRRKVVALKQLKIIQSIAAFEYCLLVSLFTRHQVERIGRIFKLFYKIILNSNFMHFPSYLNHPFNFIAYIRNVFIAQWILIQAILLFIDISANSEIRLIVWIRPFIPVLGIRISVSGV